MGTRESRDARRERALATLGPNWEALLSHAGVERRDPQWFGGVLLDALAHAVAGTGRAGGRCRVLIYGRNPLSGWLMQAIDAQRYAVLLVRTGVDDLPLPAGPGIRVAAHLDTVAPQDVDCVVVTSLDPVLYTRHMAEMRTRYDGRPVIGLDAALCARAERQRLDAMEDRIARLHDFVAQAARPLVIFAASNVYFNQLRMSTALRRRGWATVALALHYAKGAHQRDYFDRSFHIDLDVLLPGLSEMGNVVVHTQGWLNAYHIPVLIDAFRPDHVRHVVELMDVQSFFFPEDAEARMADAIVQRWGDGALEHIRLQKRCERYLVERAEGVVLTGGRTHQDVLWPENPASERFCNFPSYPLQDFFARPVSLPRAPTVHTPWRVVFAGGIPPCDDRHPPALFGDAQILPIIERLLAQNIYVDVYNNPTMIPARRLAALYPDYVALAQRDARFKFGFGAYPWDLAARISDSHFGLMLYDFDGVMVGDLHFKAIVPSKFFQYLEAGLPVLVSDRFASVCELVERYGIGVVIRSGEICRLDTLLRELDYPRLRRNVSAARDVLSMDAQIPRLEKLYRAGAGC